jgi:hypothetical protein
MTTKRSRPPRARKSTRPSQPPPDRAAGQNDRDSGIEVRGAGTIETSVVEELASIDTGWDELLAG